jgi:hypothetical protein
MRTGLSACRIRPDIAEMVIGHTKKGIVATYDRHGFEAERKAANKRHRAKINRDAAACLISECKLDEETAKSVVTAIATGKIARISIQY